MCGLYCSINSSNKLRQVRPTYVPNHLGRRCIIIQNIPDEGRQFSEGRQSKIYLIKINIYFCDKKNPEIGCAWRTLALVWLRILRIQLYTYQTKHN